MGKIQGRQPQVGVQQDERLVGAQHGECQVGVVRDEVWELEGLVGEVGVGVVGRGRHGVQQEVGQGYVVRRCVEVEPEVEGEHQLLDQVVERHHRLQ